MPVFLRNIQRRVLFDKDALIRDTTFLMRLLKVEKFDVSILCSGRNIIKSLNKKYRKNNLQTDVLAFPYFENLKPGLIPRPNIPCDFNLGDIVLGMHVIEEDSEKEDMDIQPYLAVMITHGLCHLLGYTHDTREDCILMNKKESKLLKALNEETGYNAAPLTLNIIDKNSQTPEQEQSNQRSFDAPKSTGQFDKILHKHLFTSNTKKC